MKSPRLNSEMENIVDCFTGADGGVAFMKLKILITDMENQADNGDKNAGEVLNIFTRFSKLIDFAQTMNLHKNIEL